MHKLESLSSGMTGFLLGSLVATAVVLLYAPRSGEETRREINDKVMLAKNNARLVIEDTKDKMQAAVGEIEGKAQQLIAGVGLKNPEPQ